MADEGPLARHLPIPQGKIPAQPEELNNPKRIMMDLARQSRSSAVRNDMVPSANSGRSVGPGYDYTASMIEFVQDSGAPCRPAKRPPVWPVPLPAVGLWDRARDDPSSTRWGEDQWVSQIRFSRTWWSLMAAVASWVQVGDGLVWRGGGQRGQRHLDAV